MELQFGQHVRSSDGKDIGTLRHLILDPTSCQVKRLVVEKGLFLPDDIEIPADAVVEKEEEGLSVAYTAEQIKDLPRFNESQYMPVTLHQPTWFLGVPYAGALWPVGYPIPPLVGGTLLAAPMVVGEMALAPPPDVQEHLRRQDEENAVISAGDSIFSHDGNKVGEVRSVTFDSVTGKPKSLRIREGWLFPKDHTLAAESIASVDDGVVILNLDCDRLKASWREANEPSEGSRDERPVHRQ